TQGGQPGSQDAGEKPTCSRLEAAARGFHEAINPNKFLKQAKEDCDAGDTRACLAIPMAWPMGAMYYVLLAPVLIPLGTMGPNVQQYCPQNPSTPEANATASDSQPTLEQGE
ncbi:MAG TPA: hypothetical protein VK460_09780, partial [Burkholderiales bacterium]|nr:hypothetical protein [Burkholderiales bacterium]